MDEGAIIRAKKLLFGLCLHLVVKGHVKEQCRISHEHNFGFGVVVKRNPRHFSKALVRM